MLTRQAGLFLARIMAWLDLRKYVFAYVLNRLEVFTNIEANQLKVAGTTLTLYDVQLDVDKLDIPGLTIHEASASEAKVELSTSGVKISVVGVKALTSIKRMRPDLGLSVVLEHTRADMNEVLPELTSQEQSYMSQKLADIALSQLQIFLREITVEVEMDDLHLVLEVSQASIERGKVVIESLNVVSRIPRISPRSSKVRFADESSESSDICAASETEELIMNVDRIEIKHDIPVLNVSFYIASLKCNILPSLETLILAVNIFFQMDMDPSDDSRPAVNVSLKVNEVVMADCALSPQGLFESECAQLCISEIALVERTLVIQDISAPGLSIASPFLRVKVIDDVINVQIPHPILVELEDVSEISPFLQSVGTIVQKLNTPETEESARFKVDLPDIKVQLGELTMLILPQQFDDTKIVVSEVMLTAGVDRISAAHLAFSYEENHLHITSTTAEISHDLLEAITTIAASIPASGTSPTSQQPRRSTLRITVDTLTIRGFGFTFESDLLASVGRTVKAKLKSRFSYGNSSAQVSTQCVFSDTLLVYLDVQSGSLDLNELSRIERSEDLTTSASTQRSGISEITPGGAPKIPFNVDIFVKGAIDMTTSKRRLKLHAEECVNVKVSDGCVNLHSPGIHMCFLDDLKKIPLVAITDINGRGNLAKLNFALSISCAHVSTCADTLNALIEISQELKPNVPPPIFDLGGPEGLDVFEEIEQEMYVKPNDFVPVHYFESSEEPITFVGEDDRAGNSSDATTPLDIQENYIGEQRVPAIKQASSRQIKLRTKLLVKQIILDLHDGYDFAETRDELSAAVERVSSVTNKINELKLEDSDSPIVGDFMFNSVYIGARADSNVDLQTQIDKELGSQSLCRSDNPKLSLRLSRLKLDMINYIALNPGDYSSFLGLEVEDLRVRDLVRHSKFDSMISYDKLAQGERKGPMLSFTLETIQDSELRIRARVAPLRVQIDQETLEFAVRFCEFQPQNLAEEEPAEYTPKNLSPFIQRFEVHDISLCIDYRPRKIDYAGLRSGHASEFVNLFELDRSKLVLRHIIVFGISGYDQLAKTLTDVWTPDIRKNQLISVLGGLGPLRSIFRVVSGIKRFVVVPVKEYRREPDAISGIRRGSTVLAKNTANELLKLGVRVINGPKKDKTNDSAIVD